MSDYYAPGSVRRPLRPLPEILRARGQGENPDLIERANKDSRHAVMADRQRRMSEGRLIVMALFFVLLFGTVGVRMGQLATAEPVEPHASSPGPSITSARADIVDREGRLLATNLRTRALYAHPHQMVDRELAIEKLLEIFPDLDREDLAKKFAKGRKFAWIRRTLSPEEAQKVHEIGEPGLLFASRDLRLYPNGPLGAHILGGAGYGHEGVGAAEVIGIAGVERHQNDRLSDPELLDMPLRLSMDLTVQAAVRKILNAGMVMFKAKGASAVVMDVKTGEVISMVSLPDFDPNHRPTPLTKGDQADSPLFNRAVQGVYELGSVFKIFTAAQALELGLVDPTTMIDTKGPLKHGRFTIRDFHDYGPSLSVKDVIVESSNIGTSHLALMIGQARQKEFLGKLGFLQATPFEILEAKSGRPLLPPRWGELSSMTISYGHGISTSPLHLAAGYAAMVNGGFSVRPTLLAQSGPQLGPRVISEQTSREVRQILRAVVTEGTASFGDVPGYQVGGKTGSADKPKPGGGYYRDRVLQTFASAFPMDDPQYVVIVTLDEGHEMIGGKQRRTAGWTAVPVAAEMITRIAPLLGLRPEIEQVAESEIREARTTQ